MFTHQSGGISGSRRGCEPAVHTFPIDATDPTGVPKHLGTFNPVINPNDNTCFEPVVVEVELICDTKFAGATATLAVGFTPAAYADFAATFDMTTPSPGSVTPAPVMQKYYSLVPVNIFAVPTFGGTITAGKFYVKVSVYGVNINEPNNQDA